MVEAAAQKGGLPSIGRPISNVAVYVLDQHLAPVPQGVTGELYVGGAGLARGYLNAPELTGEKFLPHPYSREAGARLYQTGDLGRYLAGGEIEFLRRRDEQVKLRGYRIELGEIEAVLAQHASVRECKVIVREDGAKQLVAYVVAQDGEIKIGEMRNYLQERLPEYMVPSAWVMLAELPLTTSGKIDQRALPLPETSGLLAESITARTAAEQVVADIFAHVLRLERVGVSDNFFDLGGHSLLATQVMSRLIKLFQVDVSLRRLFENPTVEGVVEILSEQWGARDVVEEIAQTILDVEEMSGSHVQAMLQQLKSASA